MVCVAVLACRTNTPSDIIDATYGPSKVVVPKAPALGLLLERPLFENYNKKVKEANEKLSSSDDPAYRPIINFDPYQDIIEQFKQDQIYSRMRAQESKEATPLTLDNIEDDEDKENVDTSKLAEMEGYKLYYCNCPHAVNFPKK
ncbi:hypothetical protein Clacol_005235 [Clathrus columnatus]|uniref:Uncharacterized protein n=1 Tax=Clathrus columnatus TaxID=1419009 RepID=A0AAV5ADC7_9AGAM|nr:hypothetical protein Clacol_005235 [Clathrus columnatus]